MKMKSAGTMKFMNMNFRLKIQIINKKENFHKP